MRHLLNVDLNDGLALPVVIALRSVLTKSGPGPVVQVVLGIVVGIGLALAALGLERLPWFDVSARYNPLFPVAIGLAVYAVSALLHVNEFLAAFAAGVTMASMGSRYTHEFEPFGETLTEMLKLAALLVFGALLTPKVLGGTTALGIPL